MSLSPFSVVLLSPKGGPDCGKITLQSKLPKAILTKTCHALITGITGWNGSAFMLPPSGPGQGVLQQDKAEVNPGIQHH